MSLENLNIPFRLTLVSIFSIIAFSMAGQTCETMVPQILEPIVDSIEEVNPGQTGSPLSKVAYDRVVYWVHGLSGSSSSWSLPAAVSQAGQSSGFVFDARELRSRKPEYDEHNLTVAKVDLHNEIESLGNVYDNDYNVTADRSRHFIIAHSQGGIVSRATAQMIEQNPSGYNQEFGGIVTFGSAHQGAQILNNIDPNGPDMLTKFLNTGCEDLGTAMLMEATIGSSSNGLGKSLVWKLVDFDVLTNFSSSFCEILTDDVLPDLILDDFFQGVNNGYQVDDPQITALNNNASQYESNLAKVAFYGEENRSKSFWRLLDTERKLRDPLINTEAFMYDDNDDEDMFSFVRNSADRYFTRAMLWSLLAVQTGFDDFTIYYDETVGDESATGLFLKKDEAEDVADAYFDGFIWLLTADAQFEYVSGEAENTLVQSGYYCFCINYTGNPNFPRIPIYHHSSTGDYCNENTTEPIICNPPTPYYEMQKIERPGDVIVLSESAKDFPGAQHKIRIPNTNHQKLRNAERTGERLNDLYDGDLHRYFKTEKR